MDKDKAESLLANIINEQPLLRGRLKRSSETPSPTPVPVPDDCYDPSKHHIGNGSESFHHWFVLVHEAINGARTFDVFTECPWIPNKSRASLGTFYVTGATPILAVQQLAVLLRLEFVTMYPADPVGTYDHQKNRIFDTFLKSWILVTQEEVLRPSLTEYRGDLWIASHKSHVVSGNSPRTALLALAVEMGKTVISILGPSQLGLPGQNL